ncbi:lactose-binding lectin l-2-like isoform X1 [Babylonia areolata]|uniref:lactose-binding lectin l-2-like isoform X1 n=1 Tax=Babylonia areolata TaxID=304850 RepID=UPI003FD3760B
MNVPIFLGGFLILCLGLAKAICPSGWTAHGASCFYFKKETYNWFDAKLTCQSMGGYLAEDSSSSRHEMLNRLVENHGATSGFTWIGLQDFAEENVFVWDHSGETAKQTFWGPSEPQDYRGEEDCVGLHYGRWNDLNCEDFHVHFICEKPAQGTGEPIG